MSAGWQCFQLLGFLSGLRSGGGSIFSNATLPPISCLALRQIPAATPVVQSAKPSSNVNFNTSYAATPGPLIEIFWAFCQCQWCCREVAEAVFAPKPCKSGTDNVCVSEVLVKDGPKCKRCLHHTDEWSASYFGIFIEQGKEFLETKISAMPGISPWNLINDRNLFLICSKLTMRLSFGKNSITSETSSKCLDMSNSESFGRFQVKVVHWHQRH